jgi:hypothetical protein
LGVMDRRRFLLAVPPHAGRLIVDQLGTLTAVTKGGEVVERFDAWKEEVGTALFARERGLSNPKEQKLEQGLEESMAGSDQ